MAWTSPRTWTTSEIVTAAMLNTDIRDNMNALSLHTHGGSAGDGANFISPQLVSDNYIHHGMVWPPTATSYTIPHIFTSSSLTRTWNASERWISLDNTGSSSTHLELLASHITIELLPKVRWGGAHGSLVSTITMRLGMGDGAFTADPTNGIYFRAAGNANWYAVTRASGSETATDTTIAASGTPRDFYVDVESATSVKFYIDGTLRATHSANIPATTALMTARAGKEASTSTTAKYHPYSSVRIKVKAA